jgi:hypothetical protein
MPSTDIDGSIIVMLSEAEARRVYYFLLERAGRFGLVTPEERSLAQKISRDLGLPKIDPITGKMKS